jgi:hypothetical protein
MKKLVEKTGFEAAIFWERFQTLSLFTLLVQFLSGLPIPEIMTKSIGPNGLVVLLIIVWPMVKSHEFRKMLLMNTLYADLFDRFFITLIISVLLFTAVVCSTLAVKAEFALQSPAAFVAIYILCLPVVLNTKRMNPQRVTLRRS